MSVELPIRGWRVRKQMYLMVGEQCIHCQKIIFPPRDICTGCGQPALEDIKVNSIPLAPPCPRKLPGLPNDKIIH
jgi:uncharacterized OB-fold protein